MPDPHLRASDRDRADVAAALGRHLSDGRLTVEEYDERLAQAYAARTYGELEQLFVDLPPLPATQRPAPQPTAVTPGPARTGVCASGSSSPVGRDHLRASWATWLTTGLIVTTIWLISGISGGFHDFWPIWVIGPWGAVLLARVLTGQSSHRGHRPPG